MLFRRKKLEETEPDNSPQLTGIQGFADLLGSVASLVGILLLVMAAVNTFMVYNETRSWTTSEGTVVSADIYQSMMRSVGNLRKGQGYGVRYLVRYSVGENLYISSADSGVRSWNRSSMESAQKAFPAGSKVKIRYHPENVGTIKIVGGGLWTFAPFAWLLLKIGLIVLGAGVAIRFVLHLALKRTQALNIANQHLQP